MTISGSGLSIAVPTLIGWITTNNVAALQSVLFNGADTFTGSNGGDTILGQGGADTLNGGLGNDVLDGGSGNDILSGGGGDDTLSGGAGANSLSGGTGDDTFVITSENDIASELASEGFDTLRTTFSWTLADNIERLILEGASLNGTGNSLANTLVGNALDNLLDGGIGADTLIGGGGNDSYVVDDAGDITTESASGGLDNVQSSVTWFQFDHIENLTLTGVAAINGSGNALANVITGNSAANQLFGLAGNDTLDGGAGADSIFGGEGDDLYIVDNAADLTFEGNVAWGIDLVQASVSYTLGQNIDNLTLVGAALIGQGNLLANVITGNANANTLFGFDGADTLNGAAGADQMFGGLGNDTYIVDDTADQTFEAQSAWGTDTAQTSVDYQIGTNIDNLVLQAGAGALTGRGNLLNNTLTGNESANTLFGFAGNDTLNGGLGADQLYGREGDDTYIVDNVGDVVAEANAAWGTDTIRASVTYFLAPNLENLTLTGGGAINGNGNTLANIMIGNGAANTLIGFAGNDTLDGRGGADSMFGGEGDDLYIVDNAGDVGFESNVAWGTDLVQASVSFTLGANLDNLTLTGLVAVNGTGNNLDNVIIGNTLINVLSGLGGNDTLFADTQDKLFGGAGDDTLVGGGGSAELDGGAGDDRFVFAPGNTFDIVHNFVAGGTEDTLDLSAYNGTGVFWNILQLGADTLFAFSNGDRITLLNVTAANLVQTDPFGYA